MDFAKGSAFPTPDRVADIVSCTPHLLRREMPSQCVDAPPGANHKSYSRPSPVLYENESHTTSHFIAIQSSPSSHDKADSLLKHGPQGPHMVDKTRQHQPRHDFSDWKHLPLPWQRTHPRQGGEHTSRTSSSLECGQQTQQDTRSTFLSCGQSTLPWRNSYQVFGTRR